jgi:hypothetical protein
VKSALRPPLGTGAPPARFLELGFFLQPVARSDVDRLCLLEFEQQGARAAIVKSVALELGDDLALAHDILGAELDLLLGSRQMLQDGVAIYFGHDGILYRATARSRAQDVSAKM